MFAKNEHCKNIVRTLQQLTNIRLNATQELVSLL